MHTATRNLRRGIAIAGLWSVVAFCGALDGCATVDTGAGDPLGGTNATRPGPANLTSSTVPATGAPPGSDPAGRDGTRAGTVAPGSTAAPASTTTNPSATGGGLGGPVTNATFTASAGAMRTRIGTTGGYGYVVALRDGKVLYEEGFGGMTRSSSIPVASTAKWMTSTLVMTLVDEHKVSLDDNLGRYLPAFDTGDLKRITVRQLLNHTSGIKQQDCIWATGASMAACVDQLAAGPLEFSPGTRFSYGNASYHVAGRLIEVLTGTNFAAAFSARVGQPLTFANTIWAGAGANPSPAAGASTSVEDTLHLLEMMRDDGMFRGRRILSPESVREIQKDQVVGYDTSHDYAVGITRIPTYGLGTWRDRVDSKDAIVVVSGNGAFGYYPWIDYEHDTYGIVAVNDQRGAEVAVPASRKVVDAMLADAAKG